jgi:hypothetical protein
MSASSAHSVERDFFETVSAVRANPPYPSLAMNASLAAFAAWQYLGEGDIRAREGQMVTSQTPLQCVLVAVLQRGAADNVNSSAHLLG